MAKYFAVEFSNKLYSVRKLIDEEMYTFNPKTKKFAEDYSNYMKHSFSEDYENREISQEEFECLLGLLMNDQQFR